MCQPALPHLAAIFVFFLEAGSREKGVVIMYFKIVTCMGELRDIKSHRFVLLRALVSPRANRTSIPIV